MPEARVEPPGRGADAGREVGRSHQRAEGRAWDRLVPWFRPEHRPRGRAQKSTWYLSAEQLPRSASLPNVVF